MSSLFINLTIMYAVIHHQLVKLCFEVFLKFTVIEAEISTAKNWSSLNGHLRPVPEVNRSQKASMLNYQTLQQK